MKKLIDEIDKYVKKVPALPANIRELMVQFAPWAVILTIVLAIPALLSILGMGAYLSTYGMGGYFYARRGMGYLLMMIFLIANLTLRCLSIKGLFAKSIQGWNFLFYSILLYFVYAIFTFDIVGGIIGTAISLYLIFQIKGYYK